jgi:hypothetical protein
MDMRNIFVYGESLDVVVHHSIVSTFGSCHVLETLNLAQIKNIESSLPSSENIILIDKDCFFDDVDIIAAISLLSARPTPSFLYSPTPVPNLIHASNLEKIATMLKGECAFPFGGLSFPLEFLNDIPEEANQNIRLVTVFMFCKAIAQHIHHSLLPHTIASNECEFILSEFERAAIMKELLTISNIEEIFHSVGWEVTSEIPPKAAHCYRELASFFLRMGDIGSATECIDIGESLYESPRSLALRAIIAATKGDSLTAVANLISSLQQYEETAASEGSSGQRLAEQVEVEVTRSMKQGLKALNQKDNLKAFSYFASAISKYDEFFAQPEVLPLLFPKK